MTARDGAGDGTPRLDDDGAGDGATVGRDDEATAWRYHVACLCFRCDGYRILTVCLNGKDTE